MRLTLLAAIAAIGLATVGCSKKEDPVEAQAEVAADAAGTADAAADTAAGAADVAKDAAVAATDKAGDAAKAAGDAAKH